MVLRALICAVAVRHAAECSYGAPVPTPLGQRSPFQDRRRSTSHGVLRGFPEASGDSTLWNVGEPQVAKRQRECVPDPRGVRIASSRDLPPRSTT